MIINRPTLKYVNFNENTISNFLVDTNTLTEGMSVCNPTV